MAITTFVPEIWASGLTVALEKALVYGSPLVSNTDYEGLIKSQGDTVNVNNLGDLTVTPYVKGTPLTYETLSTTKIALVIDEAHSWQFEVEDIDAVQAAGPLMDKAVRNGGYQLADVVDTTIAAEMVDGAGTSLTSATVDDAAAAEATLIGMKVALDEANVPTSGRFVVIPPWVHGLLLSSQTFVTSGAAAADSRGVNGEVGKAYGLTVLLSNNVPESTGTYNLLAGTARGVSTAYQLTETEALRSHDQFSDLCRGLAVFGTKTIEGAHIVDQPVTQS